MSLSPAFVCCYELADEMGIATPVEKAYLLCWTVFEFQQWELKTILDLSQKAEKRWKLKTNGILVILGQVLIFKNHRK